MRFFPIPTNCLSCRPFFPLNRETNQIKLQKITIQIATLEEFVALSSRTPLAKKKKLFYSMNKNSKLEKTVSIFIFFIHSSNHLRHICMRECLCACIVYHSWWYLLFSCFNVLVVIHLFLYLSVYSLTQYSSSHPFLGLFNSLARTRFAMSIPR